MSETDRTRRNRGKTILPPLAIIVIVLLIALFLIGVIAQNGGFESPAGVDIPIDRRDEAVMPEPLPAPVTPPRP